MFRERLISHATQSALLKLVIIVVLLISRSPNMLVYKQAVVVDVLRLVHSEVDHTSF